MSEALLQLAASTTSCLVRVNIAITDSILLLMANLTDRHHKEAKCAAGGEGLAGRQHLLPGVVCCRWQTAGSPPQPATPRSLVDLRSYKQLEGCRWQCTAPGLLM